MEANSDSDVLDFQAVVKRIRTVCESGRYARRFSYTEISDETPQTVLLSKVTVHCTQPIVWLELTDSNHIRATFLCPDERVEIVNSALESFLSVLFHYEF